MNNGELIARVQTKMSGMTQKLAKVNSVESSVKHMMKRIGALERNQLAGSYAPATDQVQEKLRNELNVLKSRVKELEVSREMIMAKAVTFEPEVNIVEVDDTEDVEFSIDGFEDNTDDEPSLANSFENPPPNLSTNVYNAHSALRAALTKGLVIRRHPLDQRASGAANIDKKTGSEPNRVLVQALTRQIAAISSSLSSVGNRIEDIERGVL